MVVASLWLIHSQRTTDEALIARSIAFYSRNFYGWGPMRPSPERSTFNGLRNAGSRDGTAAQTERLAPGISMILIVALSLVCWVSMPFAEMAMWSAFN